MNPRARLGLAVAAFAATGGLAAITPAGAGAAAGTPTVSVADTGPGHAVPADYAGFSIETANLCHLISLAQSDRAFVQLVSNLGPVTLRIGASTGDVSSWSTTAAASCAWQHSTVTPTLVMGLLSALVGPDNDAISWQVPLRSYDPGPAAAEAAFVAAHNHVTSIEIGNEPNLYAQATSTYPTILAHWKTIAADYRADGGRVALTGPAVNAVSTWYVRDFMAAVGSQARAITVHLYVGKANTTPPPTCAGMLGSIGRLRNVMASSADSAWASYRLPLNVNETNNYVHEGAPGVSNAYCSALWAADYLLTGLETGVTGIYFHGPVDYQPGNALGAPEYYSPINSDGTPAPEYYGLLFAHQLTSKGGREVAVTTHNAPGLDAHAVLATSDGTLRVALINTSGSAQRVSVATAGRYTRGAAIELTAPSLTSLGGITLGGSAVAASGGWAPAQIIPVTVAGNASTVSVPAYSAIEVTYSR